MSLPAGPSIVLLAIYTTALIVVGLTSSWEYAALVGISLCFIPLILFTGPYIEWLKTVLFDFEMFKVSNFSYLFFLTGSVVAYAFGRAAKILFFIAFIAVILIQLGGGI